MQCNVFHTVSQIASCCTFCSQLQRQLKVGIRVLVVAFEPVSTGVALQCVAYVLQRNTYKSAMRLSATDKACMSSGVCRDVVVHSQVCTYTMCAQCANWKRQKMLCAIVCHSGLPYRKDSITQRCVARHTLIVHANKGSRHT